jgi:predicted thioesterase
MNEQLKPGLIHETQITVAPAHAATHIGGGAVPVFATPAMIMLMEITATECVQPYLPEGHTTVGVHVDVRHLAATPMGMKVTARAELIAIDKRTLTFRVTADDEKERIGEGTHQRAIIDVERFRARLEAKTSRA